MHHDDDVSKSFTYSAIYTRHKTRRAFSRQIIFNVQFSYWVYTVPVRTLYRYVQAIIEVLFILLLLLLGTEVPTNYHYFSLQTVYDRKYTHTTVPSCLSFEIEVRNHFFNAKKHRQRDAIKRSNSKVHREAGTMYRVLVVVQRGPLNHFALPAVEIRAKCEANYQPPPM